jgi:hypothetical protein
MSRAQKGTPAHTPRAGSPYAAELAKARKAKRAGIGRAEYAAIREEAIRRSSLAGGWRPSERAMAMADVTMAAEAVCGPA